MSMLTNGVAIAATNSNSEMTFVGAARINGCTMTVPQRLIVKNGVEVCQNIVEQVCACLHAGGVVALPTDTLYGVASSLQDCHKLYAIKDRDQRKPVAICVADVQEIYRYAQVTVPTNLLHRLLPGPYTLVFNRSNHLPPHVNSTTNLVGVRIPDHSLIRAICRHFGAPLALTSANKSNDVSALCVQDFSSLWPDLDLIVDQGQIPSDTRVGSTVLDLSVNGECTVIRDGCANPTELDKALNEHGIVKK